MRLSGQIPLSGGRGLPAPGLTHSPAGVPLVGGLRPVCAEVAWFTHNARARVPRWLVWRPGHAKHRATHHLGLFLVITRGCLLAPGLLLPCCARGLLAIVGPRLTQPPQMAALKSLFLSLELPVLSGFPFSLMLDLARAVRGSPDPSRASSDCQTGGGRGGGRKLVLLIHHLSLLPPFFHITAFAFSPAGASFEKTNPPNV